MSTTQAPPKRRPPDASMELLTAIQRDTIDPEYGSHYGEDRHDRRRHRWLAVLVSFLAGLMFATSSMGAGRGNDNVASERADLIADDHAERLRQQHFRQMEGVPADRSGLMRQE